MREIVDNSIKQPTLPCNFCICVSYVKFSTNGRIVGYLFYIFMFYKPYPVGPQTVVWLGDYLERNGLL